MRPTLKTRNIFLLSLILALSASLLQAEVNLTVYQRDLVLVRDTRTVNLQKGENRVAFQNIAPGIYQPTLRLSPLRNASDLKTIELNYDYDLASQERIWHKHLGQPFQFTKDDSLYKGVLRSFDDDYIYLEPDGRPGAIALVERSGVKDIVFEALPQGLVLRPEVVWKVHADREMKGVPVEISYLSNGLTWQADYAAQILNDQRLRLQGNLTLTNTLDIDFADARIDLIAGNPHRSFDPVQLSDKDVIGESREKTAESAARFFEYRRYQVPEITSLHASQTKSLPLIGPLEVTAEKGFFYDGSSGAEVVQIRLKFQNNKESGLGVALPDGDLLLYQADGQGHQQFLGEDHLTASSVGDKVELVIGQAFDLRVDRKRMDHQRIARNRTRDVVEIELASSRDQVSKITVRERLYGYWEIVEAAWEGSALQPRVEEANKVEFDVELAPGATKTLRYVVEYGY